MKKPRELTVKREEAGRALSVVLCERLGLDWNQVRPLFEAGRVLVNRSVCRDAARRVQPGQQVQVVAEQRRPERRAERPAKKTSQPVRGHEPIIRFADGHVVVVDKPEGLTTMRHAHEAAEFGNRARKYLPATLADMLPGLLEKPGRVRPVHRLDRDTSGLVVFARTPEAERNLSEQFRAHTVGRRYLALVRGQAESATVESTMVRDRGDGRRGSSTKPSADGKQAITHVKVVEELGDFTLVDCTLETGRTHQVRIHLGEQGTPICGERVYDRPVHGQPAPDESGCQRLALHAAYLAFDHPKTGRRLHWSSPLPKELERIVKQLRKRKD